MPITIWICTNCGHCQYLFEFDSTCKAPNPGDCNYAEEDK